VFNTNQERKSMTTLRIPEYLRNQVRALGADIDPFVTFDPQQPLVDLSAQFHGEEPVIGGMTQFGCCFGEESDFGSFLRHIIGRKADRAVRKVGKAALKVGAVASFVVPGVGPIAGGSALAAMGAADKLLAGKNKKHAAKVISNTKAMAALGDPAAQRGAVVLAAVSAVRQKNQVPAGKKAIPVPTPPTMRYVKMVTQPEAAKLATQKVEQVQSKKTFWVRVKEFFHIKAKVQGTATMSPHGLVTDRG
jgi:hypothetical protein